MGERLTQSEHLKEEEDDDDLKGALGVGRNPGNIDQVAEKCAFIEDTLLTGGAGHRQYGRWPSRRNAKTRKKPAKRLSNKHPDYSETKTLNKLRQVQKARTENPKLGFTQCETIERRGATQCAGCKYRPPRPDPEYGESPLNAGHTRNDATTDSSPATGGNKGGPRAPFVGGRYPQAQALAMMNAAYVIVRLNVSGEVIIVRHDDKTPVIMRQKDVSLELSNIYVATRTKNDQGEEVEKGGLIYSWWKGHKERNRTRVEVFDAKRPSGLACGPDEFNFWQGFAVEPIEGRDRIQRMLCHIWEIICVEDKVKWEYLMSWLAWVVQNPGIFPGSPSPYTVRREGQEKACLANC